MLLQEAQKDETVVLEEARSKKLVPRHLERSRAWFDIWLDCPPRYLAAQTTGLTWRPGKVLAKTQTIIPF